MYEIEIERNFSAAHQLRGYNGDCSRLHGHNYKVVAVLHASELDQVGIAVDFKKLKSTLDHILAKYDHHNLSELPEFAAINPTSENLARLIYRQLAEVMNDGSVKVHRLKIRESDSSGATYFED